MKIKIFASAIISTLLLLAPCVYAHHQEHDKDQHARDRFQQTLKHNGFIVSTGKASVADWAQQYCDGLLPNAGYVNKAPYLRLQVPKTAEDGQLVDSFQLRHDEAIVLIGQTPPPVNYFGYYAFLWSKTYPDRPRKDLSATLGDAINNATINTGTHSPFNTPVVVIFTPDRGTDARIREVLRSAGYPDDIVNTLVFPSAMLNFGHGDLGDEFRIYLRIGKWKDPVDGGDFIQNVPETLKVFRITPRIPTIARPFPVPHLRVRGTGRTEMDYMNELGRLRQGIIAANAGLYPVDIPTKPNWYEGYDYIQQGINPGADVRDAFILSAGWLPEYDSFDRFKLADDEFLMVYGVNHVKTGKATYMNINAYASEDAKLSIGQVFDNDLKGSAAPYLPVGDPAAKVMYAYKVSRNCGGEPGCLPLAIDYDCPPLTINEDTILALIIRMYLEPATKVGPAMPEILYDRIIKFSPRAPMPQQP